MSIVVEIPQEIYTDDQACGEFILDINARLTKLSAIEKSLKEAKETASKVMLDRLEATGLKHFAFEFGTFSKTTATQVSFPTAENGGKEAAVGWLSMCLERGVIDLNDLMNVQQARVSREPVLAIEELVKEYNEKQALANPNGFEPIPDSPFNKYEQTTLRSPTKRKG